MESQKSNDNQPLRRVQNAEKARQTLIFSPTSTTITAQEKCIDETAVQLATTTPSFNPFSESLSSTNPSNTPFQDHHAQFAEQLHRCHNQDEIRSLLEGKGENLSDFIYKPSSCIDPDTENRVSLYDFHKERELYTALARHEMPKIQHNIERDLDLLHRLSLSEKSRVLVQEDLHSNCVKYGVCLNVYGDDSASFADQLRHTREWLPEEQYNDVVKGSDIYNGDPLRKEYQEHLAHVVHGDADNAYYQTAIDSSHTTSSHHFNPSDSSIENHHIDTTGTTDISTLDHSFHSSFHIDSSSVSQLLITTGMNIASKALFSAGLELGIKKTLSMNRGKIKQLNNNIDKAKETLVGNANVAHLGKRMLPALLIGSASLVGGVVGSFVATAATSTASLALADKKVDQRDSALYSDSTVEKMKQNRTALSETETELSTISNMQVSSMLKLKSKQITLRAEKMKLQTQNRLNTACSAINAFCTKNKWGGLALKGGSALLAGIAATCVGGPFSGCAAASAVNTAFAAIENKGISEEYAQEKQLAGEIKREEDGTRRLQQGSFF